MEDIPKITSNFSILRRLRKEAGMTIEGIAKKSGVSFAVISKLERNIGNPSFETLQGIAMSLSLTTSELIQLTETIQATVTVKGGKEHKTGDFIFSRTELNGHSISIGTAQKGAKLFHPEGNPNGVEICTVKKGMLRLDLHSNKTYELKENETIEFSTYFEHTYEAIEDCEIFLVHYSK